MIALRGGAEFAALALNALIVIAATRAVGPAAFGTFVVAATLGQIGLIVINAGLHALGSQRVANLALRERSSTPAVALVWRLVVVSRLFLCAMTLGIGVVANALLVSDPTLQGFIYFTFVAFPFGAVKSEWLLVAVGEVQSVALLRALGALVTAVLTVGIINDASDAAFLPLIFVTPVVVTAVAGLVILVVRRYADLRSLARPSIAELRGFMWAGRHYLVAEVSSFVYSNSDRLFLYVLAGPTTVGLYDAAYKLIQPFYAISSVVSDSMYRALAQSLGTPHLFKVFRRWVDLMSVATIPVGFVAFAFAPWIIEMVYGAAFSDAAPFLGLLGFVITFGYMSGIVTIPFTAWNAPAPYGRAVLAGGVLNLALNVTLIPSLGGIGAALSTIAAKIIVGVWAFGTFRRLTDYPVIRDFAWYVAASAIAVLLGVATGVVLGASPLAQFLCCGGGYIAMVSFRFWRPALRGVQVSGG